MQAKIITGNMFTVLDDLPSDGYDATGIEVDAAIADMARDRLAKLNPAAK